jgi:hypothetical protein
MNSSKFHDAIKDRIQKKFIDTQNPTVIGAFFAIKQERIDEDPVEIMTKEYEASLLEGGTNDEIDDRWLKRLEKLTKYVKDSQ